LSADINRTHLRQAGEKIKKACKDLDHQSRRWKGENPSLDHSRFKEKVGTFRPEPYFSTQSNPKQGRASGDDRKYSLILAI